MAMRLVLVIASLIGPPPDSGQVVIRRDEFGVPHIFASSVEAGYYGLGYAQAEDQLTALLQLFLRARGELATAVGRPALASDVEQRRWRHVEAARTGFRRASPALQSAYRHYVAGIEAFLSDHPAARPRWAPRLEAEDAMAMARSLLWLGYQAGMGLADCRRGGIKLPSVSATTPVDQPMLASDEWVLAPWRTADHATIVLSDPHGEIDGTIFYEFRLHAGPLQSSGYALGPLLLLAHNRSLGWGQTTGNPDVADCYEVLVDPANPRRFRFDGAWQTMTTRQETFVVAGGAPVTRTLEYTRHNGVLSPVVARVGDKAYVVSSAYMDSLATPALDEEVFRLNLAANVGEAKAAMASVGMYPQNVMFGDADGNIWYVRAGRTPIRPTGFDWTKPVPGNGSATAWKGIHPLADLVQVANPKEGYLSNNNIAPDMMLPDPPLSAASYPAYLFNDRPGRTNTRGLRAIEALSRAYAFTIDDAIDLALDDKWYGVESWQRLLTRALAARPDWIRARPAPTRRVIDALIRFDGHARVTSTAALQFVYWQEALGRLLPPALLPDLDRALGDQGEPPAPIAAAVTGAVDSAVAELERRRGGIDAPLGDEFRLRRGAGPSWPLGGVSILPKNRSQCVVPIEWDQACLVTLRAMTFGPPDSAGQRWPIIGSRALRLVSFTRPIRAYSLHLFGQSTDPASPHAADQIALSSARKLKPEYFEPAELVGHVKSTVTLTIGRLHANH
jgi:acyl-homoserine lactone acylase PvdQ